MKIALITNQHNYCGREYLFAIHQAKIALTVISIGKGEEFDELEEKRCGGYWHPPTTTSMNKSWEMVSFDSLKDEHLINFLKKSNFSLGIQGGTGILKNEVLQCFQLGILNFHPGDLPEYRGCSAPEWQIVEGRRIVSTCHLIDDGIDTGPVYTKKELELDYASYEKMRASIYPKNAAFLVEVLQGILANDGFKFTLKAQNESKAKYRKYIGDDKINEIRTRWFELMANFSSEYLEKS